MPLKTGFLPCFPGATFALIGVCGKSGPPAVVKPHHRLKTYAAMRHLGPLGIRRAAQQTPGIQCSVKTKWPA